MNYIVLFLLLILSCNPQTVSTIEISNVWIREVPINSEITALYFEVKNNGSSEDTLVAINTPISQRAEIHNTVIDTDGSATMVKLGEITIPSKESLNFAPGGIHTMLVGLNEKIKKGDEVKVNISFKNAGVKTVTARVKGLEESINDHMNH